MITTVPDFLTGLRLQTGQSSLRLRMNTAAEELSTGQKTDLIEASGGDLARLYAIEAEITRLTATGDRLKLGEARAGTTQETLARFSDAAGDHGAGLLGDIGRGDMAAASTRASGARSAFEAAVNAINTRFGGRSLFSGAAVDVDPLIPADQILTGVLAVVNAAADVPSALAAIDFYFNDPAGGFATTAFQGSALDAPPVDLGDGNRLAYAERADSDAVRGLLQGLATVVMGQESTLAQTSLPNEEGFYRDGGNRVIAAQDDITSTRGLLGVAEARIEVAATATAAETAALDLLRARMVARDPYEAASIFQQLEGQMQSLYTVTARLSGLSLTNFLR